MEILKTINLSKSFGRDESKVDAVCSVNVSFEKGSVSVIMGKSGSGKSTLLHLLSGIEHPTDGHVFFKGNDINRLPDKEQAKLRGTSFGFIFQFFNLIPGLNVYDNISLPIIFSHRNVDRGKIITLAEDLDIANKLSEYPKQLSGGQQQKVAIARAMVNNPEIIFADEPTGNLDEINSNNVITALRNSCKKYGQTLIIVTHDKDLICRDDRLYLMSDGEIRYVENY